MSTLITIQVNGQAVAVPPGQGLTTCLERLGYDLRLVALEFNGEILHRQHWLRTSLGEGDVLEVVTIVGGGLLPSPPLQPAPGYS
ncbi:MAG: thiamine biosynthesis protein ThiS [Synechococcus sp. SB0668_bin_15]|nr:thiamine biosynthesis protein ThiS [Synechococcus sp. SB0668_bin_15]MXZ83887.1 thiamine biosynthesis protein ThiS [Synechococcus sp. SB0666_bin_14]MYA91740.1 thiamine biosynthesis protein ThiS [Synechococcus sp. SB0663_bin_10]MYC49983.1 thiamine biosynthesis protein ThiS [Synechococcus sp. SB0662_bin_14]MYG45979.1 thiamine biosynthesis protein ThiS [Synechococcus sp. SB0675_bin_6]MYJ59434.1 thiamine biosynthesis protein ThiS [Synechococcus sp. SB0672_bin_6]MYK91624.1 thiamine biosynthesis 